MPNPVNGASGIAWGQATNAEPVPVRLRQLIVDHANRDRPVPTPLHALSLRDAGSAGLKMAAEHTFLPYQYAVELRAR